MIRPARSLIAGAVLWFVIAIVASFAPRLTPIWFGLGGAILFWALLDLFLLVRQSAPRVERFVNATLPVGVWSHVELHLVCSDRKQRVEVFDHIPSDFEHTGQPVELVADPKKRMIIKYRIRPLARGDMQFGQCAVRLNSRLYAWQRQGLVGEAQSVRVYPNFAQLTSEALRAVDTRQQRSGSLKRRRRGQGMDFEQLREYREGDSMRQIDWKATTRVGKMISREYQDERDQRIMLLVDCGRRMGAREVASEFDIAPPLSHFDRALDAVLLLAYVGLRHGDSVGLMTLGGPERFLAPQRSSSTVSRVLHAVYDLQPTLQSSDFEQAAQQIMKHERKRSLIVLFTNLRDEDDQSLLLATRVLRERHLVLVASLREPELDKAYNMPVLNAQDAMLRTAAVEYRAQREAVFSRLRANGVLCLDVLPHQLAVESINRYLAIKSAGRL